MNVRLWSNSIQNQQLKQGMMNANLDGKVETRKKYFQKKISLKKTKNFSDVLVLHMPVLPIPKMEKQTRSLCPSHQSEANQKTFLCTCDRSSQHYMTHYGSIPCHLRWCFFGKVVNGSKSLTIFVKNSILDTWRSSK